MTNERKQEKVKQKKNNNSTDWLTHSATFVKFRVSQEQNIQNHSVVNSQMRVAFKLSKHFEAKYFLHVLVFLY